MDVIYAVRTTGIVCRVGCASRTPRPENIVWFVTLDDALAAGYRPCKRCRPEGVHPQTEFRADITRRTRELLTLGLSVREAAMRLNISERHLRRLIHQETGLSPRRLVDQ